MTGGLSGQLLDSDAVVVDCGCALITPMFFDAMLCEQLSDADASVGAGLVSRPILPQLAPKVG